MDLNKALSPMKDGDNYGLVRKEVLPPQKDTRLWVYKNVQVAVEGGINTINATTQVLLREYSSKKDLETRTSQYVNLMSFSVTYVYSNCGLALLSYMSSYDETVKAAIEFCKYIKVGGILYTCAEQDTLKSALIKAGFKVINSDVRNPNTGRIIDTLIYKYPYRG